MSGRYHGESSDSRNKFMHQVFLSFRGEDVRNGFVSHLLTRLRREGFRVFMDNDGLEHGRDIAIKLQEAIERSKVSIVTLSRRYANSRWCLNELATIMKLNKDFPDRRVLPVFFDTEPTDVRHQTGLYGKYFKAHAKRFKGEMDIVDKWRWALNEVAALKGPSLKDANRIEAQLIQDIIEEVRKMLPIQKLALPSNIIGVESVVRDICDWIKDGSQDVGVGVISGQGGIGKTTIAQIAFNANYNHFDSSSFLARVSKKDNGLIFLQRKLISDISGYKVGKICSASEGMAKIRDVIGPKRILLVLDDVEEMEHLDGLFDHPEWFCPGSKIIITTRNLQLRNINLFKREFELNTLNEEESTELFSLLVFDQALPLKGYEEVSYRFVRYSGGLPLALRILGPLFRGVEDTEIWEEKLQKLEKGCGEYPRIHKILELSFDSLQDEDERNLFLHIAIFFVGRDEEYAFKILKACGVYTKDGFQNLVNRCLVSVSGKSLMMHQLIQDMGREIVRQESVNEPGLRSRLWDHEETLYMLKKNKGTTSVKGLKLAFPAPKSVTFMENHIQPVSCCIGLAIILSLIPLPRVASNLESIQTDAFAKLENLNLLELSYVQLKGGYADFPKEIKWLRWRGCPLASIPKDLELYEMAVLDMQNSQLIKAWEDNKLLGALRILNLSYSLCLRSTPDLSNANGLEWIDLEGCVKLEEIHDSIGSLRNLYYLNLKDCKNLRRFPNTTDKLHSIKEVNLSGCRLLFTPVDILSSPFSLINLFPSIVKLNLNDCGISHDDVFDSLSGFSSLEKLYLGGNPIISIRKDLRTLPGLRKLILGCCKHLQLISQLPGQVHLFADDCPSLERIEYQKNPYVEKGYVRALDCPRLAAIENVLMLEPITKLDADKAKYLGYSKLESFQGSTLLAGGGVGRGLFKGVYQCGIYSIFLDGDHLLEDWFTVTNLGSEILYTVPRLSDHPIRAFNVCCVFECGSGIECGSYIRFRGHLQIENLTTMSKWLYYPAVFPLHHKLIKGTEITWLTHWSVMLHRDVRAGHELKVSFQFYDDIPIKCGINIVYEDDEEDTDIETTNPYPIMSDNCLASVYYDIFRTVDLSEFERQHEPRTYILGDGVVDIRILMPEPGDRPPTLYPTGTRVRMLSVEI